MRFAKEVQSLQPARKMETWPHARHRSTQSAGEPGIPGRIKSESAVNGRIRRFLPGERNPAELTVDELARMVAILNATPRRCLGYRTPQEAFQEQLAALAKAA
jgi:hypothetical protein